MISLMSNTAAIPHPPLTANSSVSPAAAADLQSEINSIREQLKLQFPAIPALQIPTSQVQSRSSSPPTSTRSLANRPPTGPINVGRPSNSPPTPDTERAAAFNSLESSELIRIRAKLDHERAEYLKSLEAPLNESEPLSLNSHSSARRPAAPQRPATAAAAINRAAKFDFNSTGSLSQLNSPNAASIPPIDSTRAASLVLNKKANARSKWRFGAAPLKARSSVSLASIDSPVRICLDVGSNVWLASRECAIEIRTNYSARLMQRIVSPSAVWSMLYIAHLGTVWVGTESGSIFVYSSQSGKLIAQLSEHSGLVYCLALSADRRTVYSGSNDWTIVAWNLHKSGVGIRSINFTGHMNTVKSLLCIGSEIVWSGSDDRTVRIWNSQTGECINELRHSAAVLSLLSVGDGAVWAACEDGSVSSWSLFPSVRLLNRVCLPHRTRINHLTLVGDSVWCSGHSTKIYVLDVRSMEIRESLAAHKQFVNGAIKSSLLLETRFVWSYSLIDGIHIWRSENRPSGDSADRRAAAQAELGHEKAERAKAKMRINELTRQIVDREIMERNGESNKNREIDSIIPQLAENRLRIRELELRNRELLDENIKLRRSNDKFDVELEIQTKNYKRSEQSRLDLMEKFHSAAEKWKFDKLKLINDIQLLFEENNKIKSELLNEKQINQLNNNKITELNNEIMEFNKKNKELQQLIDSLQSERELKNEQENSIHEQARLANRRIMELEKQLAEMKSETNKQIGQLQAELSSERDRRVRAEAEAEKWKSAELACRREAEKTESALQKELRDVNSSLASHLHSHEILQKRFDELFCVVRATASERDSLMAANQSLNQEIGFIKYLLDIVARELKVVESGFERIHDFQWRIETEFDSNTFFGRTATKELLLQRLAKLPDEFRSVIKFTRKQLKSTIAKCFSTEQKLHIGEGLQDAVMEEVGKKQLSESFRQTGAAEFHNSENQIQKSNENEECKQNVSAETAKQANLGILSSESQAVQIDESKPIGDTVENASSAAVNDSMKPELADNQYQRLLDQLNDIAGAGNEKKINENEQKESNPQEAKVEPAEITPAVQIVEMPSPKKESPPPAIDGASSQRVTIPLVSAASVVVHPLSDSFPLQFSDRFSMKIPVKPKTPNLSTRNNFAQKSTNFNNSIRPASASASRPVSRKSVRFVDLNNSQRI